MSEARVNIVSKLIALHTRLGPAHRFGSEQAVAQWGISRRDRKTATTIGIRPAHQRDMASSQPRIRDDLRP
jgi:hypothetical protein